MIIGADLMLGKTNIADTYHTSLLMILSGGGYTSQYISKTRSGAKCGDCKINLPGVRAYYIKIDRRAANVFLTLNSFYNYRLSTWIPEDSRMPKDGKKLSPERTGDLAAIPVSGRES
jgi:hypothetical protein